MSVPLRYLFIDLPIYLFIYLFIYFYVTLSFFGSDMLPQLLVGRAEEHTVHTVGQGSVL